MCERLTTLPKEYAFPGQTACFSHSNKSPVMRVNAQLKLIGSKLGLPKSQQGELTLSINVVSPSAGVLEEQNESGGSLLGF